MASAEHLGPAITTTRSVAPTDKRLTQQPTIRLDYQASQRLRLTGKYTGQLATVKPTPGSIPGFNDTLQKYPFIYQPSATVDWNVTPTIFVEGTYGFIQNQLGSPIISPAANRCNVGLCDFPLLFPEAGVVSPDLYNPQVLAAINSPMLVDNRIMLPPSFSWGSLIANPPPNLIYPQFLNKNRTHNVSISATKLAGRHTLKGGFYYFNAFKAENLGLGTAYPFTGQIAFDNDPNNPLDSGFGYANAALGIFSNFSQQSKYVEGNYVYYNAEWYVQDNWKTTNRLTLDYGVRFTHQQPQHDALLQGSNFFPDKWSRAAAPLLYTPGCAVAVEPCPSASRVAINPATGASLGPNSTVAIGTIVPNSGNVFNGLIQSGQGIAAENYTWPALGGRAPARRRVRRQRHAEDGGPRQLRGLLRSPREQHDREPDRQPAELHRDHPQVCATADTRVGRPADARARRNSSSISTTRSCRPRSSGAPASR